MSLSSATAEPEILYITSLCRISGRTHTGCCCGNDVIA